VLQMTETRIPYQAIRLECDGYRKRPGRPIKNWFNTFSIKHDLQVHNTQLTWQESEELAAGKTVRVIVVDM